MNYECKRVNGLNLVCVKRINQNSGFLVYDKKKQNIIGLYYF